MALPRKSAAARKATARKAVPAKVQPETPDEAAELEPLKQQPAKKARARKPTKKAPGKSTMIHEPEAVEMVRSSLILGRIGNHTFEAPKIPGCPICDHPARVQIEEKLLFNHKSPEIAKMFSAVDAVDYQGRSVSWPVITGEQVETHFKKGHSPLRAGIVRALNKKYLDLDYTEVGERVISEVALMELLVQLGHERLVRDELEFDVKDVLTAGRTLMQLKQSDAGAAAEEMENLQWVYQEAFRIYFDTAMMIMTEEQKRDFGLLLEQNPVLRQLVAFTESGGGEKPTLITRDDQKEAS